MVNLERSPALGQNAGHVYPATKPSGISVWAVAISIYAEVAPSGVCGPAVHGPAAKSAGGLAVNASAGGACARPVDAVVGPGAGGGTAGYAPAASTGALAADGG